MKDNKEARRDAAMASAVEHADNATPGWSDAALEYVKHFARAHKEFLAEDVRVLAPLLGLPEPPDNRAWGAVIRRARKEGIITPAGYGTDQYCSIKQIWKGK